LFSSLPPFDLTVTVMVPDGLTVYWSFDEGSGSVAGDASGLGNDGAISGAAWTAGTVGGALSFDGEDDHVAVADSPTLNTNEVTFAFWIYPTDLSNEWSTAMQKTDANGSWSDWQIYARAADAPTTNHPVFRVDWDGDRNIDADEEVEGDIVLSTDIWYFIVCSYDGAQMKFYIDGTLRDSTSVSEGTIPNSGRDIWLGGNDVWGEFFEGIIDEVRIYNRALREEEIQLLAGF